MALVVPLSLSVDMNSIVAGANGLRYASACALTILVWDHLVTMKHEFSSIWCRPVSLLKVVYVLQRYGETAAPLLVAYADSGMSRGLDTGQFAQPAIIQFCQKFLIMEGVFGMIMLGVTNFVVMSRVYALWDHRKNVLRALYAGFIIKYAGVFVMGILSWHDMVGAITWDGLLTFSCVVQKKPTYYKWIWVFQLIFDTFMIALAFLNASHRPRKLGVKLIDSLKRDGAAMLGVRYITIIPAHEIKELFDDIQTLFVFRLVNLVLCLLPNIAYMFSAIFIVWALNTVTMLRLILRLEGLRVRSRRRFQKTDDEVYELAVAQTFSLTQSIEFTAQSPEPEPQGSGSGNA